MKLQRRQYKLRFFGSCCCYSHWTIVAYMDMEKSEVFLATNWRGCLIDPHTSSNLLNYYITLADLWVGRFAVMSSNVEQARCSLLARLRFLVAILERGFEPKYKQLWKIVIKFLESLDFKVSQRLGLWVFLTN